MSWKCQPLENVQQPVLERARRCRRAHRDFEELGDFKDLGDFCRRPLRKSGQARVMNRVINLIVGYVDHQLELFFSLSLFQTMNWCDFYQLFSFVCANNSQAPGQSFIPTPQYDSGSPQQDQWNWKQLTQLVQLTNKCNSYYKTQPTHVPRRPSLLVKLFKLSPTWIMDDSPHGETIRLGLLQQHLVDWGAEQLSPFFEANKNLGSILLRTKISAQWAGKHATGKVIYLFCWFSYCQTKLTIHNLMRLLKLEPPGCVVCTANLVHISHIKWW